MNSAVSPLSHHDILVLAEPITRAGHRVDLAATDRLARRIVFKSIEHPALDSEGPAVLETLELHLLDHHHTRLVRNAALTTGLTSVLQIDGYGGELLARIRQFGLRDGFQHGAGFAIASSYHVDAGNNRLLSGATAEVRGLQLALEMPIGRTKHAELGLSAHPNNSLDLPDDLFAVLGRPWGLLRTTTPGWRSRMSLKGQGLARSHLAESRFQKTVRHLAVTLDSPPQRYHEQWFRQRWSVVLRRSLPLLASVVLVVGAGALTQYEMDPHSALRVVLFEAAPIILALAFMASEVQRLELPTLPKPLKPEAWPVDPSAHKN